MKRRTRTMATVVALWLAGVLVARAAEAGSWAERFAQWRAECHNTFLRSRSTAGVGTEERVYKVTRDCIEAAERDRFPYLDLAQAYANARGHAERLAANDPAKGEEALTELKAQEVTVLTEIARREEADTAHRLKAIEILQQGRDAERQRQEMRGLREGVGAAREAAEAAQEEARRARQELQLQEMRRQAEENQRRLERSMRQLDRPRCMVVAGRLFCW